MAFWPGFDEVPGVPGIPVVINAGRPARNRPRLATEHAIPKMYRGPDGQLFVPAGAGMHRSSSVSGGRPAQVIINNDQVAAWDDHGGRRPRSLHGHYYYDYSDHERSRSHSRHRRRSRTPSPYYEDPETREKLRRLEELEKKDEEVKREKRLKEKLLIERAKAELEAAEREKEEKELKKRAVEEWKIKEEKEKIKKKKEQEEADEEFKERLQKTLWASGYSEDQIARMVKKTDKKGNKHGESSAEGIIALSRPTYIRVRRKHLDPETLETYGLPWQWDATDDTYIVIKQWIPERDQDILFEHTRNLREKRQITYTTTELKKERDSLVLIRKKEPKKKSWFLT